MRGSRRAVNCWKCVASCAALGGSLGHAGVIFNYSGSTLGGGSRWDASPRIINLSGNNYERSLNGGLRYSLQGGSFQAYRNLFSWSGPVPSVPEFQAAV